MALSFRPKRRIPEILGQVGAAHQCHGWDTGGVVSQEKEQFLPRVVLAQNQETKTGLNLEQDRIGMQIFNGYRVGSQIAFC